MKFAVFGFLAVFCVLCADAAAPIRRISPTARTTVAQNTVAARIGSARSAGATLSRGTNARLSSSAFLAGRGKTNTSRTPADNNTGGQTPDLSDYALERDLQSMADSLTLRMDGLDQRIDSLEPGGGELELAIGEYLGD